MRVFQAITVAAFLAAGAQAEEATFKPAACEEGQAVAFEDLAAAYSAILFGEYHGTTEMPEAFGNAVAQAAGNGRRIVVALEYPPDWQDDLDSVMAAPDEVAAMDAFAMHHTGDGRTSDAMRNMLLQLRALKLAGADIHVIAADKRRERTVEEAEQAAALDLPDMVDRTLGQRDIDLALHSKAACEAIGCDLILLYAGNMHTRLSITESGWFDEAGNKTPFWTAPAGYVLAQFMPAASVYLFHRGGYGMSQSTEGMYGMRKLTPSAPEFVAEDEVYYCTGGDPMFSHALSVGKVTPSMGN